ncbi:CRE-KSR-2 protein [Caenorhabditis remanei]|uniref:CRE-KSR-2 protein n=1 Tax=Caenorhabditis remanei TaxID=31234 RepID=E3LND7_CAERE|nr:CRE-KSR-2 protein [Caenorhabditis remanei]
MKHLLHYQNVLSLFSISQSRASTSSATTTSSIFTPAFALNHQHQPNNATTSASTSSEVMVPPASAPPRISIYHKMVKSKSKFRQCDVCERFFIFDFVRRQQLDDVFACNVCGIRVHEGCLERLKNDCKMTKQIMGGILENAVIQSNKKQWEEPTPAPTPPPPTLSLQQVLVTSPTDSSLATTSNTSPNDFNYERNVHTNNINPMMTMTASTLDDIATIYSENLDSENTDYERDLMQWRDITIQLSDVHIKTRIGDGRFGTVHLAEYHGDAAVKFVNMSYLKDVDRKIEVFTQEIVSAYKNSRHDHIALFYGYVADLPTNTYAIVTNFYHNKTLYHLIHEQTSDDFDQSWIFQVSLQICQAMSYLHKKKILHRDLRSKNILLDNPNRVVVADFALMKLERLSNPKRDYTLCIPQHWLDYLAPEVAGNLMLDWRGDVMFEHELLFTSESDVYSFGTIFFELLLRKMPTGCDSWEQKLYAKMCGQKAALQRLDTQLQKVDSKFHDLLMSCWSNHPEKRPTFTHIVKRITSMMPRKESNKQKRRSTAHENPLF